MASLNEFQGGSYNYYHRKVHLFSDFIICINLFEARYTGSSFTWCNNQTGTARKWARLDRCLLNIRYISYFDSYLIKNLPRIFSDHAPLLLTLTHRISLKKKVFRFDNFWLDYIGCHDAVREAWNFKPHSNPMHAFSYLISRARSKIILGRIGACVLLIPMLVGLRWISWKLRLWMRQMVMIIMLIIHFILYTINLQLFNGKTPLSGLSRPGLCGSFAEIKTPAYFTT